ncbi:hypothetical protein C1N53_17780 [Pontibacter sp. SGAir0037]|nr:hypothetical protein C1N53_17780 [Pontibacter sp. SGAir0037]
MPYEDASTRETVICPHCGTETTPQRRCPACGNFLPKPQSKKWKIPKMNAAEIFLAILGLIVLAIGLVAV